MRRTSPAVFTLGMIAGIAFVVTCDTSHSGDGGLGIPGAQAQSMALTVDCNQVQSAVTTTAAYTLTTDTFFADVPLSGLDPTTAPHVSVILCQLTNYTPPTACAAGATCSTSGTPYPTNLQCSPASYYLDAGRLVVNCGYHIHETASGNPPSDSGYKYAKAYIRIN